MNPVNLFLIILGGNCIFNLSGVGFYASDDRDFINFIDKSAIAFEDYPIFLYPTYKESMLKLTL